MNRVLEWVQKHPLAASFAALGVALLIGFLVALPSLTQTSPSAQSSDKVDQEIAAQLVREANENGSDYVSLICGSDTSTAIAVLDDDRHLASRPTYVAALSQLCNR